MNKEKAKNITLGVSLILNLLGSLLIGGSLIHACNASPSPEKADLSPVTLAVDKMDGLSPRKAETATLSAGLYTFNEVIDLTPFSIGKSFAFVFNCYGGVYTSMQFGYANSGGGDLMAIHPPTSPNPNRLYYVHDSDSLLAYRTDGGFEDANYRDFLLLTDQSVDSSFASWIGENSSFGHVPPSSSESSASSDVSSSSASSSSSSTSIYPPVFDYVRVPSSFWGYRALNGSYDANTGGLITTAEISGIWSGGFRIGGVPFTLGESDVKYDAIEFYYFNFYSRDYMNEKGEIVSASSDGFKNVLYLSHVSVLPQGSDASVANNWIVIGSSVYGTKSDGSLYIDAHRFNWLDQSYKSFKVERTSAPFVDNYAVTGLMTDGMINPILRNMNRSEAFRLALTGTSADVSGGVAIGGDGYTDVFSLIGSAFSSLVPILSVQVLPYLTIGTLLLVPLIVLVIFAILKVLNK